MERWEEWSVYGSPIGPLTLGAGEGGVGRIAFPGEGAPVPGGGAPGERLAAATAQLAEYFAGARRGFEVGLDLRGTPLQLRVWELLRQIPFGATTSYGELTAQIDAALFPPALEPWRRVRAVGTEIGRTPTPIVVPCHRVIGADGSLVGYGGGLERKAALLDLERRQVAGAVPVPAWGGGQMALI